MINHPNRSKTSTPNLLIAYHGKKRIKTAIMKQLAAHREADEIVKGRYWEGGKGCAVGCTIYSGNHAEYEPRFGIPQMLARLEDTIFEGLPNAEAKLWPERFMGAVKSGTDLTRVGWQFLHWLLTDETVNPGINHTLVRDAVKQCVDVLVPLMKGLPTNAESAARAARSAARAAESARAARAAWSAAWSAESAARAARAAESARSAAAESARSAAESAAAWSAESAARAARAARAAAYLKMADKIISLIEQAAP